MRSIARTVALSLLTLAAAAQEDAQDLPVEEPPLEDAATAGEFAEWVALDPALVHAFRAASEPVTLEGVELALGDREGPRSTILVTSFDRQVADAWVRALVARVAADPAERETFAWLRVVVLPTLARHGGDAGRFGVDFPVGWRPGSLRAGAAEVPLPSDGSRVLAEWLLARRDLVAVVALDGPDRDAPLSGDPASEVLARALGTGGVLRAVGGEEDGGWLDFARAACGLWTVAPRANGLAEEGAAELLGLARRLPRLELALAEARPLAVGLWQVDLEVRNLGVLPGAPPRRPGRRPVVPPTLLEVEGVTPLAVARREGGAAAFAVDRVRRGAQLEPTLAGGGVRTVRLVVELAGEAGRMDVRMESPRLGSRVLVLELGPDTGVTERPAAAEPDAATAEPPTGG